MKIYIKIMSNNIPETNDDALETGIDCMRSAIKECSQSIKQIVSGDKDLPLFERTMERLHRTLREYNQTQVPLRTNALPSWRNIYLQEKPPAYWTAVSRILLDIPKDHSVLEIGSGLGDVTALILCLGFEGVLGLEKDANLAAIANEKMENLFNWKNVVLNQEYPIKTATTPDVLIQVNCIYADQLGSKKEFLERLRNWYEINGTPKYYILEVVDETFDKPHQDFPPMVRTSSTEIRALFPDCAIESIPTYTYPENKSIKTLYIIKSYQQ